MPKFLNALKIKCKLFTLQQTGFYKFCLANATSSLVPHFRSAPTLPDPRFRSSSARRGLLRSVLLRITSGAKQHQRTALRDVPSQWEVRLRIKLQIFIRYFCCSKPYFINISNVVFCNKVNIYFRW